MPVIVVGLKEAQKAMRNLQPDLAKNLNAELHFWLLPVVAKAKGYVPNGRISGLSRWTAYHGKFPSFHPATAKRGIHSEFFPAKRKTSGFISMVRIVNSNAAAAIFETAGRKSGPSGQPWDRKAGSHDYSHSRNKHAGEWFINQIGNVGKLTGVGDRRGRLIYRAWAEDQGKALGHVLQALNKSALQSKKSIDSAKIRKVAA